ncbi:MAG: hypothetical protein ACE5HN_10380, partial [Nitrospiria bacterium]
MFYFAQDKALGALKPQYMLDSGAIATSPNRAIDKKMGDLNRYFHRKGGAYIKPPSIQRAFRPRDILNLDFIPR